MTYDLVVRGGTVIDGSGLAGYRADIGVLAGRIAAIGRIRERGREEIGADGCMVTPGFIDGHTHMDAQVNWDPLGTPSSWHGVTTVVMGNCGFTLAPSREGERGLVVRNLERAEDISPAAMAAGIDWRWETFPQYLDVLERLPMGINYAVNIGHSALRTWAMGERAFEEQASEADVATMQQQLRAALQAGALGLTTSRSKHHETSDNRPVASRIASWDEVRQLVDVMRDMGAGMFELALEEASRAADPQQRAEFFARLQALAVDSGVPVTFGVHTAVGPRPAWEEQLQLLDTTAAAGGRMFGQSHSRGVTVLLSFQTNLPFDKLPLWDTLRRLPLEEQARRLRDPDLRRRLVDVANHADYGLSIGAEARKPDWDILRVYQDPLMRNPSIARLAQERGVDPVELMIDLALDSGMRQFFIQSMAPVLEEDVLQVLRHPRTVMTFSDAGAHVSQINDASIQTHLLAYWARERQAFSLPEAVRMVTLAPAIAWGFSDRGLIREGMVADLNVFDYQRLTPSLPQVVADIPGGARRLISRTDGISATVVGGQVLMRDGLHTGALPGQLIRGSLASIRR